jgi:hypothetical protein
VDFTGGAFEISKKHKKAFDKLGKTLYTISTADVSSAKRNREDQAWRELCRDFLSSRNK